MKKKGRLGDLKEAGRRERVRGAKSIVLELLFLVVCCLVVVSKNELYF